MDILPYLEGLFGGNRLQQTCVAVAICVAVAVWLVRHTRSTLYRLCGVAATEGLLGVVIGLLNGIGWAVIPSAACLAVAVLDATWCFHGVSSTLDKIVGEADRFSSGAGPCRSLELLRTIDQRDLIGNQRSRYDRYMIFTLVALGDNKVASIALSEDDKDPRHPKYTPAFRHFALHVIAERAGDYEASQAQLNGAMAHKEDADTDPLIAVQLDLNQAVLHIDAGQPNMADADMYKALRRAGELGVKNVDFLNSLYSQLILNKTRLGLPDGGCQAGFELIDQYAKTLDLSRWDDVVARCCVPTGC